MKQRFVAQCFTAVLCLSLAPTLLWAQHEKSRSREKGQKQQIVITRDGDEKEKMVIEIDGEKIKINGRETLDLKNIDVQVRNLRGSGAISMGPGQEFNFDFEHGEPPFFSVDSNRAMLGIVTDAHERGARVQTVSKESAAEKAGIKKGDIITKINDKSIVSTDDVTAAVRAHKPGDKISITYLREGKEQKTLAELSQWKGIDMGNLNMPRIFTQRFWRNDQDREMSAPFPPLPPYERGILANRGPKLGLSVQDTDNNKGVKVLEVEKEGNAAKAGIKENDIITHVDNSEVKGADDIARIMRDKKDQASVQMSLLRNGKTQTVDVRLPKKIKTVEL